MKISFSLPDEKKESYRDSLNKRDKYTEYYRKE